MGYLPRFVCWQIKKCVNKYCKAEAFVCLVLLCVPGFMIMLVNLQLHPCKGRWTILCQPGRYLDICECQQIGVVTHAKWLSQESSSKVSGCAVSYYAIWGDDMAVVRSTFKCLNFHFNIEGGSWQQKDWGIGERLDNFSRKLVYVCVFLRYLLII